MDSWHKVREINFHLRHINVRHIDPEELFHFISQVFNQKWISLEKKHFDKVSDFHREAEVQ